MGFYEKNTHKLIEINECKITKKSINKVINLIKSFNLNYANIILRSNYNDEILIIINSKENIIINDDLSKYKIVGIILNDKTIYGENHFMEKIDNLYFDVNYDAFFQVNNYINSKLFEIIKENVSGENILDLYSGVGTLSIMASQNAGIVYAIEVNENAVKSALLNAKINKVKNVCFILGKVEDKINLINDKIDTVIVDPPRSGLDKKTMDYLKKIKASKIIYISCDTQSLANNLNDLINDYIVEKLYLLDMFSYTYHVECILVLHRK
ncbi:MAG: class I SAM-dependent RNA methyltransferase [Bacilli bacterium]